MLDVEWSEIRFIQSTLKDEPLLIRTDGDIIMYKLVYAESRKLTRPTRLPRSSTRLSPRNTPISDRKEKSA